MKNALDSEANDERERDHALETCKRALHKVDNLIARAEKAEKDRDAAEVERDDAIRTAQDNAARVAELTTDAKPVAWMREGPSDEHYGVIETTITTLRPPWLSENHYRPLYLHPSADKQRAERAEADLAAAHKSLLLAKDACRLAREHKPIPWSFLEAEFDAALGVENNNVIP